MARPIALELPARDPREELRRRLEQAPVKHVEALLDSYELLQQLHDHGVLELVRGALSASDNPDVLQSVATAAADTLGCYEKPVIEPPNLFSLLCQFRHKELRRSIALINRFLEKLGGQMNLRGGCK